MKDIVAFSVGVLGFAFGLRCYLELWRWAKQCQRAHIVIARNRRVQLNASLAEWLGWANRVGKEENGRVVYRNNNVSVSILRRDTKAPKATTTVKTIRESRRSRKDKVAA